SGGEQTRLGRPGARAEAPNRRGPIHGRLVGGRRHCAANRYLGGPVREREVIVSRSRWVRRWAVALAAATVLTACGGGGGGGGLGGGNVSAQQYVKSTCTSLGAWVRDVQKRVAAVSQQNPSTAAAGKKLITSFFEAVVADTGKLI